MTYLRARLDRVTVPPGSAMPRGFVSVVAIRPLMGLPYRSERGSRRSGEGESGGQDEHHCY